MTAEIVGAVGSVVSSVVVVVGAFAALRQLRHLRASNEVTALQGIIENFQQPSIVESIHFIQHELSGRMADPEFVRRLACKPIEGDARAVLPALNFWEQVGNFVLIEAVSERTVMQMYSWPIVNTWNAAAPAIAVIRGGQSPSVAENFEHLAALATRWFASGHGAYAERLLRMPSMPARGAATDPGAPDVSR